MRTIQEIENQLHDLANTGANISGDNNLLWELLEHAREKTAELEAREIINDFLSIDDWLDETIASASLVERARRYVEHGPKEN